MAKLVGFLPMAWERFPAGAQGCDRGAFHQTRQNFGGFFFCFNLHFFFCMALLDVQRLPARSQPPRVPAAACSGGNPLPNTRTPMMVGMGMTATRRGDTAHARWVPRLAADGWPRGKHTAQKREPGGLGRIGKRWEDGESEQEGAKGLAGAGSCQAAHATGQGSARHRLAPAPAIWSSNHPLVASLL